MLFRPSGYISSCGIVSQLSVTTLDFNSMGSRQATYPPCVPLVLFGSSQPGHKSHTPVRTHLMKTERSKRRVTVPCDFALIPS